MGDLFDSPWKIAILAILIIVLFGSTKLPVVARSLGKSMRILKTEMRGLHDDDGDAGSSDSAASAQPAPPAQLQAPAPAPAQPAAAEAEQTQTR